jgi:hypothetical protein
MTSFGLEDFSGMETENAGDYENKKSLGTFFETYNVPLREIWKMGMHFLGTLCKAVGHTKNLLKIALFQSN